MKKNFRVRKGLSKFESGLCEFVNHPFNHTIPSIAFETNIKFSQNLDENLKLKLRLDARLDEQYSQLKFESSLFWTRISEKFRFKNRL